MRAEIDALKSREGEALREVRREQQELREALEGMRADHEASFLITVRCETDALGLFPNRSCHSNVICYFHCSPVVHSNCRRCSEPRQQRTPTKRTVAVHSQA